MQHHGHPRALEHRERLVIRVAGVDHERQAQLVGQLDLRGEHPALVVGRGVVAVEVEADLAQRDHPGTGQQRAHGVDVGLGGLVRVPADDRPHAGMAGGQLDRLLAADREDALDAGGGSLGHRGVGALLAALEVRVGVDHFSTRGNSGSGWCTSLPAASVPSAARSHSMPPGSPTAARIFSAEAGMYGYSITPSDRTVSASV